MMTFRFSTANRFALGFITLAALGLIAAVVHAAAAQHPASPAPAASAPASAPQPTAARGTPPATAAAGTCLQCHSSVTKHTVLHPKTTDCASCHVPTTRDAHQFKDRQCAECHQMVKPEEKFVHGPVAAGECLACHAPHGSEEPQQVRVFGPQLCEQCHVDIKSRLAEKRFTHEPVKEDCATCHDPHASVSKHQIRTESADQCLQCHKTLRKQLVTSRIQHEAVSMDKQCVNCHDPHSSDFGKQLKATSMELCLSCHDREVETPKGKVQNIKGWIEKHTDLHGPLRQQDCVGCHLPHDSEHFRLLKKEYPETFYSPFEPKNYALCFTCHEPEMAKVERTSTATGFRDGDRNLHFLHVNRAEKGRTCRACHEAHSSSVAKHMRESVPFGNWSLRVGYQQTDDGGRCTPGCHLPMTYTRNGPSATTPAAGAR